MDLETLTILSSHPGLPSEVTSITPIQSQPHHYYLCHKRGFELMRIEAPSSLERLTETYMRGQEIRCLVPCFNSKNEYIINGFEEDGELPMMGVWDSEAEIVTSKIEIEESEEVVKVSENKDEEVYVIK
jgi:hypothetical protein